MVSLDGHWIINEAHEEWSEKEFLVWKLKQSVNASAVVVGCGDATIFLIISPGTLSLW